MRFGNEHRKIESMCYLKKLLLILLIVLVINSCKEKEPETKEYTALDIKIDSSFAGARLSNFQKVGENRYKGYVLPENQPINASPWFAFAVHADTEKSVEVELNYGSYRHRYVPKLSHDGIHWKALNSSKVKIDTIKKTATLSLDLSSKKLFVAAQELEPSAKTYAWVDSLVSMDLILKKVVAGKTILGNDNYVLQFEGENVKNSIVLVARQHPPEIPGGTIGFKSFFETVFSDTELAKSFRKSFNIYTFPLLNPDGADLGNWRHNGSGVDLNRDWIEFSQPETKMVRQYLKNKVTEGKEVVFSIDFHTSFSGPYLLVLDSLNEKRTNKIIPEWIDKIEKTSDFKVEARRRSQELPYCYNYFFNELGSEAVTYEEGDEIERAVIKKRAKRYAEELMKTLLSRSAFKK